MCWVEYIPEASVNYLQLSCSSFFPEKNFDYNSPLLLTDNNNHKKYSFSLSITNMLDFNAAITQQLLTIVDSSASFGADIEAFNTALGPEGINCGIILTIIIIYINYFYINYYII